jgi:peptide/nickel transport system ATP-binding protein
MTALLELDRVSKRFERRLDAIEKLARAFGARVAEATVHAVDDVSLVVAEGEGVGLEPALARRDPHHFT